MTIKNKLHKPLMTLLRVPLKSCRGVSAFESSGLKCSRIHIDGFGLVKIGSASESGRGLCVYVYLVRQLA
jgi:hypothetical protein